MHDQQMNKAGGTGLPVLVQQINAEHELAKESFKAGCKHAQKVGELLLEAKKGIQHGDWLPWLHSNCSFSERTAQGYMRLARVLPKLDPENAQRVADLSFRDALRGLAQDTAAVASLDKPAIETVLERSETVERLKYQVRSLQRETNIKNTFALSPALLPRTDVERSRKVRQCSKGDHWWTWEVTIGPNQAGVDLQRNMEMVSKQPEFQEKESKIEAMDLEAQQLRQEAEALEGSCKLKRAELRRELKAALVARFGPAHTSFSRNCS